jgi:hypothetical protein
LGDWLLNQFPVEAVLDLVKVRDYSAAHELAGAHEVIQALFQLAEDIDEEQKDADAAAVAAS